MVKRVSLKVTYRRGRAIGIEIVDPSQCGPDRLMDVLKSLGQPEVDRDEFRPLAAA